MKLHTLLIFGALTLCSFRNGQAASFATFDAPGAVNTFALGINTSLVAAGFFQDTKQGYHGFLRGSDGSITAFDAPGAGTTELVGTLACCINDAGTITGRIVDNLGVILTVRSP
jgi:hypothetical protein